MEKRISGIPEQKEGGFHDTESQRCYESTNQAIKAYSILKKRFLDINDWQEYAGTGTAEFSVFNDKGNPNYGIPEAGYFLKINVPAPGNDAGDGFDWVRIQKIEENQVGECDERCLMVVHPSSNPNDPHNNDVAHFYTDKASSNFLISRKGNCITAEVHGRNETANLESSNLTDTIRNLLVSTGGRLGAGKIQWKLLTDGLLDFEL